MKNISQILPIDNYLLSFFLSQLFIEFKGEKSDFYPITLSRCHVML